MISKIRQLSRERGGMVVRQLYEKCSHACFCTRFQVRYKPSFQVISSNRLRVTYSVKSMWDRGVLVFDVPALLMYHIRTGLWFP